MFVKYYVLPYNNCMKTVIFGCGKIAKRIAKGFEFVKNNQLVGFASRDIQKAQTYAEEFNVELFGDYEYFLNNKDIDCVYIATYNINHYELIKNCLNHNKHVLCEKPMLSNIKDNEELFELAKKNNCLLMEAMKAVFLPINIKVKEMIQNKTIGDIKYIEASFVRGPRHPENHWIYDLKTGGALKDLGSYCAAIMNYMTNIKPKVITKTTNKTDTLADTISEVYLDYDGISGHLLVSNEISGESSLRIYGTKGFVVIPEFWKVGKGYYVIDGERFEIQEEMINDFYYEIQHFTDLINNKIYESPIMSRDASNNIILVTK